MITDKLYAEWDAIIALRRRFNTSGQDGCDFDLWLQSRGVSVDSKQLELFP